MNTIEDILDSMGIAIASYEETQGEDIDVVTEVFLMDIKNYMSAITEYIEEQGQ